MRFLILTLSMLAVAVTVVWTGRDEYDGRLPAVDVTAPRYEFEDEAWSGLMPAVEVVGVRSASGQLARTVERGRHTSPLVDLFGTPIP